MQPPGLLRGMKPVPTSDYLGQDQASAHQNERQRQSWGAGGHAAMGGHCAARGGRDGMSPYCAWEKGQEEPKL